LYCSREAPDSDGIGLNSTDTRYPSARSC
jgi:hypothetical protein